MNAVKVKKVSKEFSGHMALDEVSLEVPEKSVFGLLGPNGAGKTTLIRIINQITAPDSGEVHLFGEKLNEDHIGIIGYLPEERGLYRKMKVGEQCLYLAQLKGMSASEAKKRLLTWFDRFEITAWWDKKVEELSKGMAQKIQFVTTVLHEPKLLILDEPFSGFDPINVEIVRSEILRLRDEGATVMLSTHNMGSVEEMCDSIALVESGKVILNGGVEEVKNQFDPKCFNLTVTGNMIALTNALWTNFELVKKTWVNEKNECVIKLLNDSTLNDLLSVCLPAVEIHEVEKVRPSMHDIFIESVAQAKNPEELVEE
jgi:ABC-2 type transport system ATP-binding protein